VYPACVLCVCTLIVLHGCIPDTPLAVGANRDEFFGRPAEGPLLRNLEFGAIVAPLDKRAGGTWLGLNEHGLFAALTNRPMKDQEPDAQRRSRGLLVLDALRERSATTAATKAMENLEQLPDQAYNSFNLLVADRDSIHAITYERSARRVALRSGPIVICNSDPEAPPTPKLESLHEGANRITKSEPQSVLDDLAEICRSHDTGGDPFRSACVHAGEYGTRSSTLIRLGEDPRDSEFRFTDERPCESEYQDYTPLLRQLNDGCRLDAGETAARKSR